MIWMWAAMASVACFLASLFGTRAALAYLDRRAILDRPNERSSHLVPTPRGAGIAVMAVLLPAWALVARFAPGADAAPPAPLAAALVLAVVSWRDDLAALPALLRLSIHLAAVLVGMLTLAGPALVFQGLFPWWLDRLAVALAWLWFLNLFNFMDGIDGIAGAETATLGLGVALAALLAGLDSPLPLYGLTAAAAALGFLRWNWHPARIFLGDVGSVPLGYLLAWLLLELASRGLWAAALLLPLYYLADATLTLIGRLLRGERFWRAHREHFYQKAVRGGLSHARVVAAIMAANGALVGLALWATAGNPWPPLGLGVLATLVLLCYLGTRKPA